jgi:hypothetical protein
MRRIFCFPLLLALAGCASPTADLFPIGIYGVRDTNAFPELRAAGFNLVAGPARADYLNAAQQAGLGVLAAPGTSAASFDARHARRIVKQFDRHPALWAWYLADEPDLNHVPPETVREAHRSLQSFRPRKPAALVLQKGENVFYYGGITPITMIDRYPVPWLPLADFGHHIRMARLGTRTGEPLLAVIQAFDWSAHRDLLPDEENTPLRPPTYEELRCMTYCALAERANGFFFYAWQTGGWNLAEQPETWQALQEVVREVNERLPLFKAEHLWWPRRHGFADPSQRFNAALASSISSVWLRVHPGNISVPSGDYILAVNNTDQAHTYGFSLPRLVEGELPVLDEDRSLPINEGWVQDWFEPYAVRLYGPFGSESERLSSAPLGVK